MVDDIHIKICRCSLSSKEDMVKPGIFHLHVSVVMLSVTVTPGQAFLVQHKARQQHDVTIK